MFFYNDISTAKIAIINTIINKMDEKLGNVIDNMFSTLIKEFIVKLVAMINKTRRLL